MKTADYLQILRNEIHSTVFATTDEQGRPHTRVIDIMLADEDSLYFITAKGKQFYAELKQQKFAAISGMTGGEGSGIVHAWQRSRWAQPGKTARLSDYKQMSWLWNLLCKMSTEMH